MRVDLRSDTVTKPSEPMRAAMARAEVGDDVYGEDPTVNALQDFAAELIGKEAALYVPSGSMANQIALMALTRPGDDVLIGSGAHNYFYESGAGGALAGVQFTVLGEGGLFTAADVAANVKPDNHHNAPTRLVCVENTHNRGGGRVFPLEELSRIREVALARSLALHMDGARLFNAQAATSTPARVIAEQVGSLSICLSKGLGAPVGSLLLGGRDFIWRCHRYRKMLGGGMRQAGILAAAGLYALKNNVARLAEDHANAKALALALAGEPGFTLDPARVETNIVIFDTKRPAAEIVARAKEAGVLVNAIGPNRVRAVTHLDVDRAQIEAAAKALSAAARQ
jgi:threonine aldolase